MTTRILIFLLISSACLGASKITEETIHFVGGDGTKAGLALPGGGCTVATYSGDPTDYFATNGAALVTSTGAITNNGSGKVRLTDASAFGSVLVGTLMYLDSDGTHADGVYEITAVNANYIDLDLTYVGDEAAVTGSNIGGAYATLQAALNDDSTDVATATTKHNRYILTNKDETISSTLQPEAGDRATGKFIKVIGYNSEAKIIDNVLYTDMDVQSYGSPYFTASYYGGAIEAIREMESASRKRPNGDWISIDADDNAIDVLTIAGDNCEFRNLYFHNTDKAAGNDVVYAGAAYEGTTWINCRFDDAEDLIDGGNLDESAFLDCYFGNVLSANFASYDSMTSTLYSGCVFNGNGKSYAMVALDDSIVIDCLFYAGGSGINMAAGASSIIGSIIYKQDDYGIRSNSAAISVNVFNNIFSQVAASDVALLTTSVGGTFIGSNNCVYSVTADAVLTTPFNNANSGAQGNFWLKNTQEVNPQFVDPANFDFRLQPGSPLINAGIRGFDPDLNFSSIGTDNSDRSGIRDGYRSRYKY